MGACSSFLHVGLCAGKEFIDVGVQDCGEGLEAGVAQDSQDIDKSIEDVLLIVMGFLIQDVEQCIKDVLKNLSIG